LIRGRPLPMSGAGAPHRKVKSVQASGFPPAIVPDLSVVSVAAG
jgi:hypothetical protein